MSKRRRYLLNQLKTGIAGGAIKRSPHRIAGKYAKHPAIIFYSDITEEAVEKLLADGVNKSEIEAMKNDTFQDQSMFRP
jgi:hypothetical protein